MHGLIAGALNAFIKTTYGAETWVEIARAAEMPEAGFDLMRVYPDPLLEQVVTAACDRLGKDRADLMQDMGIFLVSHPGLSAPRRLLRFSGESFSDFLLALEDLPGRVRLALPDLELPGLRLQPLGTGCYRVTCHWTSPDARDVLLGILRAMADDYGALVLVEAGEAEAPDDAAIEITLLDARFSQDRGFALGGAA